MKLHLDQIDRKLLRSLQIDSRLSVAELGEIVGLSPSACHRRVRALETSGIIRSYEAKLDGNRLGYSLNFFVEVVLTSQSDSALRAFEAAIRDIPEVLECNLMAGQVDYVLRVASRDHEDFERIHSQLISRLPGVARVHSNLRIRTVKPFSGVPV
mgnify:CR=1 FL=1